MKKTNAARILDRLKIPYEIRTYSVDETDLSAEMAAQKLGLPLEQVFKTLVAKTDCKQIVLACLPGSAELNLKALGAAAGGKRSDLVPLKDVQSLTSYIRGGVSPLGTRKPYPVFLDRSAETWETIAISAGLRGVQILITPSALIQATNATIGDFTRQQLTG